MTAPRGESGGGRGPRAGNGGGRGSRAGAPGIARIDAFPVRVPFRVPFATAAGEWTSRASWLVRVTDGRGLVGWGEAALEDEAHLPVLAALLDDAASTGLVPARALLDRAGPAGRAIRAALDGARLDILAQSPEARFAGRPTVGVNATLPGGAVADVVAAARRAVGEGYRTLKLKAAPDETAEGLGARFAAVREAVGPGVALRLDANGTWTPDEARARLAAIAPSRPQYVEQPLAPDALAEAAALREATGVAIAADEAVDSAAAVRAILDAGAADVLVVKPSRVGGPVVLAEIALLAASRGVPVVVSTLFETGIGLATALACAAALPDVPGWPSEDRDHGLATADLLEDDLLAEPLVVEDGRLRAPFGEGSGGFGVRVDEAAVARYEADLDDGFDAFDEDDDEADEADDDVADVADEADEADDDVADDGGAGPAVDGAGAPRA